MRDHTFPSLPMRTVVSSHACAEEQVQVVKADWTGRPGDIYAVDGCGKRVVYASDSNGKLLIISQVKLDSPGSP